MLPSAADDVTPRTITGTSLAVTSPDMPAIRRDEDLLSLGGLWSVTRRHRWLVPACVAGALAIVGAYVVWGTRVYEATAQVRVLDTKVDLPDLLNRLSTDREVSTEMGVLSSRRLGEAVIDSLGLRAEVKPRNVPRSTLFSSLAILPGVDSAKYVLSKGTSGSFTITDDNTNKTLGTVAPGGQFQVPGLTGTLGKGAATEDQIKLTLVTPDEAYTSFDDHLKVSRPVRDANLIAVRYRGTDPELVKSVPNTLASLFMSDRQSIQKVQTRSTIQVLQKQLDSLARELATSEDVLEKYRQRNEIVSLPAEGASEVQHFADLQATRNQLDAERMSLRSLFEQVASEAARGKPDDPSPYRRLLAFPSLMKNDASSELFRSLAAVDDQRTQLLLRRTPRDSDVVTLTQRQRDLEAQVRSIASTYLMGLTAQVTALDSTLSAQGRRMNRIPSQEMEYERLARQPAVLDDLYTKLQTRLKEAQVADAIDDPSVQLMDPAVLPVEPIRPKPVLYLVGAALLGLLAGLAAAMAREKGDYAVHTRAELTAVTGTQVLGLIPRIDGDELTSRIRVARRMGDANSEVTNPKRRLGLGLKTSLDDDDATDESTAGVMVSHRGGRNAVGEAYSRLQTNLAFLRSQGPQALKTFVVTSALSGDGKTTSAVNLALALHRRGHRVLLVDGDLRRGVIHRVFGGPRSPGLADVVAGSVSLEAAVRSARNGTGGVLQYLPTGTLPAHAPALLESAAMQELFARLGDRYDAIIVDSPPINVVVDAALLGSYSDGVLLVARAGVTPTQALTFAMEQLQHVGAPVLGSVLNDIDYARDVAYDRSYRFYKDAYYTVGA